MKIALGSAQFGLNYGISNTGGKVPVSEVRSILSLAKSKQINIVDTAYAYGDSEAVLGSIIGEDSFFNVVSKTRSLKGCTVADVLNSFDGSMFRLKKKCLYALLIHDVSDLLGPRGPELLLAIRELKQKGRIQKLGVSVYDSSQIEAVLALFPIDIIQIPFNVFDQRLVRSGHLTLLKIQNIEIHARSIFLQGLLLMSPDTLPAHLVAAAPMLKKYRKRLDSNSLSPLEGALLFTQAYPELDYGVFGVCSADELKGILEAQERVRALPTNLIDFSEFSVDQVNIVNPARWGAPKH